MFAIRSSMAAAARQAVQVQRCSLPNARISSVLPKYRALSTSHVARDDKKTLPLQKDPTNHIVAVANVPRESKWKDLHKLLSQFGKIKNMRISRAKERIFYVHYEDEKPAADAVSKGSLTLDGTTITTAFPPPRPPPPPMLFVNRFTGSEDDLTGIFKGYNTSEIRFIPKNPEYPDSQAAIVTFPDLEQAHAAQVALANKATKWGRLNIAYSKVFPPKKAATTV